MFVCVCVADYDMTKRVAAVECENTGQFKVHILFYIIILFVFVNSCELKMMMCARHWHHNSLYDLFKFVWVYFWPSFIWDDIIFIC